MKKSVSSFLILFSLALVFESCCTDTFRITGNGSLFAYDSVYTNLDTIKGEFILTSQFETSVVANFNDFSLIPSAHATTCERNFENTLIESTLKLSTDKAFVFDNESIEADTDFSFLKEVTFNNGYDLGYIELTITQDFIDKVDFQHDEMTFKVEIQTDDGLDLANEITLSIDL